jgi:hypothetical protein
MRKQRIIHILSLQLGRAGSETRFKRVKVAHLAEKGADADDEEAEPEPPNDAAEDHDDLPGGWRVVGVDKKLVSRRRRLFVNEFAYLVTEQSTARQIAESISVGTPHGEGG